MNRGSPDKTEAEKGNEDSRNYSAPNMSSNWRYSGTNLINTSMGLIRASSPMVSSKGDLIDSSSCSTASMVDSFCPPIWDKPNINSQNMAFCDAKVQNNATSMSTLGFRTGNLVAAGTDLDRALEMGWTPHNSMLKQNMLSPTSSRMIPQSLSQFPTDSGFIERAARFSCFSGGNFSDIVNPFSIPESTSPYTTGAAKMQGEEEVYAGSRLNSIFEGQYQKNEMRTAECSKDGTMPIEHEAGRGSPLNNERKNGFLRSNDQEKQGLCHLSNESDEGEFGCGGVQAEASASEGGGTPAKTPGLKKRKRLGQDTELDQVRDTSNPPETTKDNSGIQLKGDQNPTSTVNKPGGKRGNHGSQASDSNKEEYIHVRARRGQATNSHSLAERVRREKISERMKFLQDLVPGCSKVTGKAVMLDEIINYVQSLQRQVEFLSMKLATVNPRLDLNIEGILAKDILLQSRAGPSSTLGFHPDMSMPYTPMHLSQHGLVQAGLTGMGPSDALQRSFTAHLTSMSGGYKLPNSQVPNVWDDELHNIVQMGLNSNITLDEEDLQGPSRTDHMKAEL